MLTGLSAVRGAGLARPLAFRFDCVLLRLADSNEKRLRVTRVHPKWVAQVARVRMHESFRAPVSAEYRDEVADLLSLQLALNGADNGEWCG